MKNSFHTRIHLTRSDAAGFVNRWSNMFNGLLSRATELVPSINKFLFVRRFADFSREGGAQSHDDLPALVEPFVTSWMANRGKASSTQRSRAHRNEIRGPVEQLLLLILPTFVRRGNPPREVSNPFVTDAPDFFDHLRDERGLKEATIKHYHHDLLRLEAYIRHVQIATLNDLSPAVLSAFITESVRNLSPNSISGFCSAIRVFLRYAHREGLVDCDLAPAVEAPRKYRLSEVPRSISWDDAGRMLEAVDRRYATGKRDYPILLLLLTYGLRGCEVAALTLDDIDWDRERILIPERKAGHCTAYPRSTEVGDALLTYLTEVRPRSPERRMFLRTVALKWMKMVDEWLH